MRDWVTGHTIKCLTWTSAVLVATLILERLHQQGSLLPDGTLCVTSIVRFVMQVNRERTHGQVLAEQNFCREGEPGPVQVKWPADYSGPWNDRGCVNSVRSYITALSCGRDAWVLAANGQLTTGRQQVQRREFTVRIAADAVPRP